MASYDAVNYVLRPNKNVERKLLFEALRKLEPRFEVPMYRYIGLGSIWFIDFVLAHKLLGVRDMVSIQDTDAGAERARFNRPYGCIDVVEGETTKVLPELELGRKRAIIWLDYDSDLHGPALNDIPVVCGSVPSGSVVLVTLNAHRGQLSMKSPEGEVLSREDALRALVGDLAPPSFGSDYFNTSQFPNSLAQIVIAHLDRATRLTGRPERFRALFNFSYQDNAPMITVGGMIANAEDALRLEDSHLPAHFDYVTGRDQYKIDVPLLTPKEKAEFDQLLPCENVPSAEEIRELGFPLKLAQIASYHRLYRHYPMFAELAV